jgi:hypothetical protein
MVADDKFVIKKVISERSSFVEIYRNLRWLPTVVQKW